MMNHRRSLRLWMKTATLTSSNALEGLCRRARLSARNRITNGCCTGASQGGAAEECLDEVQEERAVVTQQEPEAVDKVNKDEVLSNTLEGPRR